MVLRPDRKKIKFGEKGLEDDRGATRMIAAGNQCYSLHAHALKNWPELFSFFDCGLSAQPDSGEECARITVLHSETYR